MNQFPSQIFQPSQLVLLAVFLPLFAQAADLTWLPATGDWSSGKNWSGAAETGMFASLVFNREGYDGTFAQGSGVLTITAVPEPSTLGWPALGGLLLLRRKGPPRQSQLQQSLFHPNTSSFTVIRDFPDSPKGILGAPLTQTLMPRLNGQ